MSVQSTTNDTKTTKILMREYMKLNFVNENEPYTYVERVQLGDLEQTKDSYLFEMTGGPLEGIQKLVTTKEQGELIQRLLGDPNVEIFFYSRSRRLDYKDDITSYINRGSGNIKYYMVLYSEGNFAYQIGSYDNSGCIEEVPNFQKPLLPVAFTPYGDISNLAYVRVPEEAYRTAMQEYKERQAKAEK